MTEQEIDAMSAGPEMDALVAERVMGLHAEMRGGGWWLLDDDGRMMDGLPRYSEQIAAAWQVVEKMAERWHFALIFDRVIPGGSWIAEFNTYVIVRSKAPTAPEAICKAALKSILKNGSTNT